MWAIAILCVAVVVAIYLSFLPSTVLTVDGEDIKACFGQAVITGRMLLIRGDSDFVSRASTALSRAHGKVVRVDIPGDRSYSFVVTRMDMAMSASGMVNLYVLWSH